MPFNPTIDFGDRTERLFTNALDFAVNEDVGCFVQIPQDALAVKFRFRIRGKSLTPIEKERLQGGLTGIQELETYRDIGWKISECADDWWPMIARYMLVVPPFEQAQNLLKKGRKKIRWNLEIQQSGFFQAVGKPIPPITQYRYSVQT